MRAARRISASPSGPPGQGDDDTLAGLAGLGDAVLLAVTLQVVLDGIG